MDWYLLEDSSCIKSKSMLSGPPSKKLIAEITITFLSTILFSIDLKPLYCLITLVGISTIIEESEEFSQ